MRRRAGEALAEVYLAVGFGCLIALTLEYGFYVKRARELGSEGKGIAVIFAKTATRLSMVAALAGLSGCNSADAVKGNGATKTETRDVGPFNSVSVDGVIRVDLVTGPFQKPVISGDANLLKLVTTTVTGNKLIIHQTEDITSSRGITVTLHAIGIKRIDSSGAGKVHATGLAGPTFTLHTSGAGEAELTGQVDQLELTVSGAGRIHAAGLATKEAQVEVSGAGAIEVNAKEKVKATVSGSGAVRYRGSPAIEKDVSGSGTVVPMS